MYRTTSKVITPSKTYWSSPRTKTSWSTKVGPYTGSSAVILPLMDKYMRETSRTFGERFKEHLKKPSLIHHHSNNTGHPTTQHNFQIIWREGHGLARSIKEPIFIRVNNLTLNRSIGKFNLPHIWDRVLLNTPCLTLKGMHRLFGILIPTNIIPHPIKPT